MHLVKAKEKESGKEVTRFRVSEATLKRLFGRRRIPQDFLSEVEEWLFEGGWALFFAGSTYAMIKVSAVEGWTRLSSKRIAADLKSVSKGEFNFAELSYLLNNAAGDADDEEAAGD